MAGGQAGRQAVWGRSLWSLANAGAYCRGFSRADPGTSSQVAGGNVETGLAPPLQFSLGHSLPPPTHFRSFGQGSCRWLWSLTQPPWAPRRHRPGKWDRSGWPGRNSHTSEIALLTSHPTYLTWINSTHLTTRATWERAQAAYLQPLVNTLGMELMVAGQDSEQLPHLKVTEADHTPDEKHSVTPPTPTVSTLPGVLVQHSQSLLRLMAVRVKAV